MSWLSDLVAPVTGDFVKSVGDTVRKFVTTDKDEMDHEEAMKQLNSQLEQLGNDYNLKIANLNLESQKDENANVTQRWLSDNSAGGLPAMTRPLLVWWAVLSFTIISFCDGNIGSFHINPVYIPIYQMILATVIGGYMGLRTFEKYTGSQHDEVKLIKKGV